jgi:hypothetical protein
LYKRRDNKEKGMITRTPSSLKGITRIPHKPDNKDTTEGVATRITRVDNKDSTKRAIT